MFFTFGKCTYAFYEINLWNIIIIESPTFPISHGRLVIPIENHCCDYSSMAFSMLVKDINPSCSETGIFWTNKVNITIAGVLVPRIVKPSTDMRNIMWYKRDLIFPEEDIQLPCRRPVSTKSWGLGWYARDWQTKEAESIVASDYWYSLFL